MTGSSQKIETGALAGLRGLAALHVMFFHFLLPFLHLQGSMEMPTFYLLSGFTLTMAYGRKEEKKTSIMECIMENLRFYQNRFARIAPNFYLANIVGFCVRKPQYFLHQKNFLLRCIFTLTMTNSWFSFLGNDSEMFNFPSWTISSFAFMYLIFPLIISRLQILSDASLARAIVVLYYVQLLPFFWSIYIWDSSLMEHLGMKM